VGLLARLFDFRGVLVAVKAWAVLAVLGRFATCARLRAVARLRRASLDRSCARRGEGGAFASWRGGARRSPCCVSSM
jgi:hypothetical protein